MTTGAMRGSSKPLAVGIAGQDHAVAAIKAGSENITGIAAYPAVVPVSVYVSDDLGAAGNGWLALSDSIPAYSGNPGILVLKTGFYLCVLNMSISGNPGDQWEARVDGAGIYCQVGGMIGPDGTIKAAATGSGIASGGFQAGEVDFFNFGTGDMSVHLDVTLILLGTWNGV